MNNKPHVVLVSCDHNGRRLDHMAVMTAAIASGVHVTLLPAHVAESSEAMAARMVREKQIEWKTLELPAKAQEEPFFPRQSAYERAHSNQPWYIKFSKHKKRP